MKLRSLLLLSLSITAAFAAQSAHPGLKAVLSEAEWKRAGLDQLTPDQIGVIDAALIRHAIEAARLAAMPPPAPSALKQGTSLADNALARARFFERFGLDKIKGDWREQPPLVAKVTSWQGANRFSLDTGQVWEGVEAIPYEILGREVTIEARPMDGYALKAGTDSVAVRVRRVR